MKIFHALPATSDGKRIVLAIGFFDGLHRGHRSILTALLRERRAGYRAAVLTFRNHPATFLRPDRVPPLISTLEERVDNLGSAGIDELYLLDFDEHIASLEPGAFMDDIVLGRLGARALVVGENFRFGAQRAGDAAFARDRMTARGARFAAVPRILDGGERVSSTRIRTAISSGDLALADALLGGTYSVRGRVGLGEGRGHDLGFPTANLEPPEGKLLPADGVYSAVARHDGRDHAALVSVGTNPTFDGRRRTVEAWLRDFEATIYGEELSLREWRFVRTQQRFDSAAALLAQMRDDVRAVPYPSFATLKEK